MQVPDEPMGLDAPFDYFITLKLADGSSIKVHRRAAQASKCLKGMMDVAPFQNEFEFKQTDLTLKIMTHVVEYLHHYQDQEPKLVEKPLKSDKFADCTSAWNAKFVEMPIFELLYTMTAANFLQIDSLVNLTTAAFACMFKCNSLSEMQKLLGLPENDKVLDGEEKVREKYPEYFAWLLPPEEPDSKMD